MKERKLVRLRLTSWESLTLEVNLPSRFLEAHLEVFLQRLHRYFRCKLPVSSIFATEIDWCKIDWCSPKYTSTQPCRNSAKSCVLRCESDFISKTKAWKCPQNNCNEFYYFHLREVCFLKRNIWNRDMIALFFWDPHFCLLDVAKIKVGLLLKIHKFHK